MAGIISNQPTNPHLSDKLRDALLVGEAVMFATNRDIIAILPSFIRALLWTLILGMIAYSVSGAFREVLRNLALLGIFLWWGWFFIVPFFDWRYEVLAFTQDKEGYSRALYRERFWRKKIHAVKMSSFAGETINQYRAYYLSLLGLADVHLDIENTKDDIHFKDCDGYKIIAFATQLGRQSKK